MYPDLRRESPLTACLQQVSQTQAEGYLFYTLLTNLGPFCNKLRENQHLLLFCENFRYDFCKKIRHFRTFRQQF
jgi:hypothetical protein